jgi:hypothetical protein
MHAGGSYAASSSYGSCDSAATSSKMSADGGAQPEGPQEPPDAASHSVAANKGPEAAVEASCEESDGQNLYKDAAAALRSAYPCTCASIEVCEEDVLLVLLSNRKFLLKCHVLSTSRRTKLQASVAARH